MHIKRFKRKKKKKLLTRITKLPWKWMMILGPIFVVIFCIVYGAFFLPSVKDASELSFAESTIIYDREALLPGAKPEQHILYVIHGDENREYMSLEEISPWMSQATVAIEDDQFYSHFGFDLPALVKVFIHEAFGIGPKRGGSTITQQLAKQVFLSSERSYIRKFKELLLSIKLEWHYSKDEILELYLNKIPYGNNAYGVEAAARTYFGKSARDLTITESAILASIPNRPTTYNPYGPNKDLLMGYYDYKDYYKTEAEARASEESITTPETTNETDNTEAEEIESNLENEEITDDIQDGNKLKVYKKGRKDLVLQRMLELDFITQEQFQQAWGEGLYTDFKRAKADIKAPHFVFYVRQQMEDKYGKEFLDKGGLRIYTTLDPDVQNAAEEVIAQKSANYATAYGANNVALTSINPDNGEILAYIGGKDFFDDTNDGQVDVLTSRRQPGSSFKPMVFAAGFEEGYAPGSVVFDVETDFGNNYKPQNFDQKFRGPTSFRKALNASLNIPAIKMAYLATPDKVLKVADKIGIKYEGDSDTHGVAIGVGVAEVEPLSHINAYQTFAGDGSYYEPTAILEIRNADGKVLEKTNTEDFKKEGLDPEVAAMVRNILTDETTRPTTDDFDWNNLLQLAKLNNGAKTGTSNRVINNPEFNREIPESDDNRRFTTVPGDSWTIGFTPHLVTGVWVGNNRGKPMKSGSTGMTVAAPIWKATMENAHEILIKKGADPDKEYNEPKPLQIKEINALSGKLATEDTPENLRVTDVFPSFNLPTETDNSIIEKEINIFTGKEADEKTPKAFIRKVKILNLASLKPDLPNWQTPVEEWLNEHPEFLISLGVELEEESEEDDTEENKTNNWRIPEVLLRDLPPFLQKRIRDMQERGEDIDWSQLQDPSDQSAPKISILSPKSKVTTGQINVMVSTQAKYPIESVEYYLDDELIYQAKKSPFTGKFTIPEDFNFRSKHTIKAVLLDENFGIAEDEITVTVGADDKGPEIIILGPFSNQSIPINSEIQIQAQVTDLQSSVDRVEFLVNNKSLGISTTPPFTRSFTPTDRGRKTIAIKAWDTQGNVSNKSIPVNIERENIIEETNPFISEIDQRFRTVYIETTFPSPDKIEAAQLVISKPEKIILQVNWDEITRYKQVYLPKDKNLSGTATAALYIKRFGEDKMQKINQRTINF